MQSNALAALEAIDKGMADKILAEGCITGDRINGLVDGATGKWYRLLCLFQVVQQLFTVDVPTFPYHCHQAHIIFRFS